MDRFEAAFPTVWAKTWVVDPSREEDWRAADQWIRKRLRDAGVSERHIQQHSNNLFLRLRHRSPQYFGAKATAGDVVAGVVIPVISHESWADRIPRTISDRGQQDWAIPNLARFNKLERPYAVYTFDHETAHAIYHELPTPERPYAKGAQHRITPQQDETFADIAGGLGSVGHFGPTMATDTIARIAHLRSLAAVHKHDIEHLTTRGLKRAMDTIGQPGDEASRWQLTGMAGARALARDIPRYAFSQDELDTLRDLRSLIKPSDTQTADKALITAGALARKTPSPVIYEVMRDYIEAVEALVPADRYQPGSMMRAKLNARRNPLAAEVDAQHPRVETIRMAALTRVQIYQAGKRAANQPGEAAPSASSASVGSGTLKPTEAAGHCRRPGL